MYSNNCICLALFLATLIRPNNQLIGRTYSRVGDVREKAKIVFWGRVTEVVVA